MLHRLLLKIFDLLVVSGAVMEQHQIADVKQQLHHAEAPALAPETRAVKLDATQNDGR